MISLVVEIATAKAGYIESYEGIFRFEAEYPCRFRRQSAQLRGLLL
jgi:hypothetical protein